MEELHRLLVSRTRLPDRKLKQSHNQSTPPFHHPFTLYPATTPLPTSGHWVDGRNQFPSLALPLSLSLSLCMHC